MKDEKFPNRIDDGQKINMLTRTLGRVGPHVVSFLLRDLLPTLAFILVIGWASLQLASQITETKESHADTPINLAATH
ncbi:MAG: hypothetical protein AB7F20_05005 [Geoalkalibacter sp.]|uniref:hypothetical protein n=1 Tax=Geoalkalibacter sp. TaxID=3041440 RepID=UPI003D0F9656